MKKILSSINKFLNELAILRAATSAARLRQYDEAVKIMSSKRS
jgi:hypothetical protein